jgi:glyoxylate reductase
MGEVLMKKILVTGSSVRPDLLQPLMDAGHEVVNPTGVLSENDLRDALSGVSAYLFGGDEFASGPALAGNPTLKHVAFLGVGYESFMDAPAITDAGVLITNTPGTLSNSVAEFTLTHLLNATRKFVPYAEAFARGVSGNEEKQHDLADMHVGLVGLGGIGTRVAEILRAGFGAKVSYFSRTRKLDTERALGLEYATLIDLVGAVDALIVMTPGNDSTRNLINLDVLAAAKPGLLLINTARESVVAPDALLNALKSGQVGYAGFDGFYDDDTPALEDLKAFIPERLAVTGHIASLTHEARDGMAIKAVQSILKILDTGHDEYVVNSTSGW